MALSPQPTGSPVAFADDVVLVLSTYLAQQCPVRGLPPLSAGDALYSLARALEWIGWLGANNVRLGRDAQPNPPPGSFTDDESAFEPVREKGRERAQKAFVDIDERVSRGSWALGDRFSFVDAYLLAFYRRGGKCGFVVREAFPHFARVMDSVRARPAAQKVVTRQDIEIEYRKCASVVMRKYVQGYRMG